MKAKLVRESLNEVWKSDYKKPNPTAENDYRIGTSEEDLLASLRVSSFPPNWTLIDVLDRYDAEVLKYLLKKMNPTMRGGKLSNPKFY